MSIQLRIPGQPTSSEQAKTAVRGEPLSGQRKQPDTHLLDAVEVLGAFDVSHAARGDKAIPHTLEAEEDDLIEFVLEDGVSMWTSVKAYRDRQYRLNPELRKTTELDIEPVIPTSTLNRGIVKDLVTGAVRILRLKPDEIWEQAKDPKQWPEWV